MAPSVALALRAQPQATASRAGVLGKADSTLPRASAANVLTALCTARSYGSEAQYGKLLGPYLDDPENLFVVSSDFCHWGTRFSYTYYNSEQVGPQDRGFSRAGRGGGDLQQGLVRAIHAVLLIKQTTEDST